MISRWIALLALMQLVACGRAIYDDAIAGEFQGSILVMWVGAGDGAGDGEFVYVPDVDEQGRSLRFLREPQKDPAKMNVTSVKPQWMYTDGGSIPRLVQPVKGLNPWGYAPAYMVHDWLFVARKCLNDNKANADEAKMAKVEFRESFEIMAEMLKTLEQQRRISDSDLQPRAITWAVSTGVSRRLWNQTGACPDPRISKEHQKQIEARLRIGRDGRQKSVRIAGEDVAPAQVVQAIGF